MREIAIQAGVSRYPVQVGTGLLQSLPAQLRETFPKSRFAIVTDENVAALYAGNLANGLSQTSAQCHVFTV